MVTIKEMAQELGVSTTTVSNVIHGKTKEVSPANIERIQKILKKYDYTPNINARNLASKRSKIIGFLIKSKQNKVANRFEDPFIGGILGAAKGILPDGICGRRCASGSAVYDVLEHGRADYFRICRG